MYKKAVPIVIVTLFMIILIGIKTSPKIMNQLKEIGHHHMNVKTNKIEKSQLKKKLKDTKRLQEAQAKATKKHRDPNKPALFPFSNQQQKDLAKKYPDQFEIVKKMFYSLDFIDNAQGQVEWGWTHNEPFRVKFSVDFLKKRSRYKWETLNNGKVISTKNVLYKNGYAIEENPNKHVYMKETSKDQPHENPKQFENHFLDAGNIMLESEWWALIYDDYKDWHYKVGMKFGMPVYEIDGNIPYDISNNLAGRFTMTVSKKTGALLDLKCYGKQKKQPIYFVKVTHPKMNQGIPDQVFHLNVSNDKKVSFKNFPKS